MSFGMRTVAIHSIGGMTLAFACALAAAPATAQSSDRDSALSAYAMASPPSNPADAPASAATEPLNPDESALLGNALTLDPATLAATMPTRPLRLPGLSSPKSLDVSRDGGSGPVVVKQPLPTDWDASVGAEINSAASRPGVAMPVTRDTSSTGTAWVQVGVPNFATFDARVDPTTDQRRIGATFKQPIGSQFAVTLQNNYSVTETNGSATAAASDIPMMTVPRTAVTAAPMPAQIWGNENVAKLDFLPTGTSFAAGVTTASNDPVTHHRLSADQRLYGPLHVTTAVTDVGQPTESKSITAGLRLNW